MVPRIIATSGRPQPSAGENRRVQPQLPTGTVTFLFTDIEGSTRLLRELGDGYADVLAEHRRALRESWRRHDGRRGRHAGRRLLRRVRARDRCRRRPLSMRRRALAAGPVRVRMGLHTGEPARSEEGYVGFDVHRAARIAAAGHGGQVLLSQATADLAGADVRDLGLHRLEGPECARASVPARDGRLPATQDAARDEPAGSGDAVPRARARDRGDRSASAAAATCGSSR